ncbi:hypothetical protein P1059_01814 [Pasteurella multocida subsp. gallicida P1059]|nr:hypothetical protein P1059_01814 [Pasteurella multocida subsp. gallicida P1059]
MLIVHKKREYDHIFKITQIEQTITFGYIEQYSHIPITFQH